jgi:hypothetical protein
MKRRTVCARPHLCRIGESGERGGVKLLAQSAQRRLIQAGRFLRPETEPQGGGDDVGEESLVSRSRVGLGRHGCRTIAAGIDGPVLAAVRGKESGGSCLTDLLRSALEIEIAIGIRGRENSNTAQYRRRRATAARER